MTTEILIKGFFALVFSGMFAWIVFDRDSDSNIDSNRQRYLPYISGLLLPLCLLTLLSLGLIYMDKESTMQIILRELLSRVNFTLMKISTCPSI